MQRVNSVLARSSGLSSSAQVSLAFSRVERNLSCTWGASSLYTSVRGHSDHTGDRGRPLKVTYRFADGTNKLVKAYHGQNLLEVAMENELPVEGACAGSCACSTCHLYLKDDASMELFPEPSDEENDMLDLAFFCQPTSRLGCQLVLDQDKHDGLEVELPRATRNMAPDGYVPKPH